MLLIKHLGRANIKNGVKLSFVSLFKIAYDPKKDYYKILGIQRSSNKM